MFPSWINCNSLDFINDHKQVDDEHPETGVSHLVRGINYSILEYSIHVDLHKETAKADFSMLMNLCIAVNQPNI